MCSYKLHFKPLSLLDYRVICNSSGSGKTRRMLEGFTKHWGFYFVAAQDINRVGIPDLADALDEMGQDPQWVSDLRFVSADARARQNDLNSRIARKQLQKILAARTVVFKLFLQLAIKVDGKSISAFGYYSSLNWVQYEPRIQFLRSRTTVFSTLRPKPFAYWSAAFMAFVGNIFQGQTSLLAWTTHSALLGYIPMPSSHQRTPTSIDQSSAK